MRYARLGKTGLKVSRICLGCMTFGQKSIRGWNIEKDDAVKIVETAWKAGVNFFDTANVYNQGESETILGAAIKELGIPRNEVVIATKVYAEMIKPEGSAMPSIKENNKGLSRKHIFEAVEASLQRLQTSYIDLYQIHRWDNDTPIEETMKALHDLVEAGKVRYIGASTMFAWQFIKAQTVAEVNGWTKFVSMQNLYNLVYREEEKEMNRYCAETGVGLIPWSPLAGGYLAREASSTKTAREETSAPFRNNWFDESTDKVRQVVLSIAKKRQVTPAEVALAWVLQMEGVTSPIIGVSQPSQLAPLLKAVNLKLTESEFDELALHYRPRDLQGYFPTGPKFGRRAKL